MLKVKTIVIGVTYKLPQIEFAENKELTADKFNHLVADLVARKVIEKPTATEKAQVFKEITGKVLTTKK